MKSICSFCQAVIREDAGPDNRVSHGVCPSCYRKILSAYGFNARKFLELFDAPVLLVDDDARVLAANHLARAVFSCLPGAGQQRYCGDVLECVNACLENGCGKTRLCPDCIIRSSVTGTHTTGLPVTDRPATLCRRTGEIQEQIRLLVSTRKDRNVVLLRLRPIPGSGSLPIREREEQSSC